MNLKKIKKKVKNYINKIKHLRDKYIIISMGENCLTDDILSRNDLKSFSSPFSSGRSNVEYILSFEKEGYIDFLNPKYLKYEEMNGSKVARNKKYVTTKNKYYDFCMNGMEFTHHDVINDPQKRKKIAKRCKRIQNLANKNIVFVYHNRYCKETDMNLIISYFEEIRQIYESRNNHVQIYIFTQKIVPTEGERHVECTKINGIKVYFMHTLNVWEGGNQEIFWARCDNDLLKVMIDDIRENTK